MIVARLFAIGICVLALSGRAAFGADSSFHFFTEKLPPYSFLEDETLKGISTDLLVEMLARAKLPYRRRDITMVPWARGYAQLQARPNTILYSTVRSKEREPLFRWVGPIMATRTVIWARRQDGISIEDLSDLKQYRIGVSRDSVGHEWLRKMGIPSAAIVTIAQESQGGTLLARGRIDLWVADATMATWEMRQTKLLPSKFEIVHSVLEASLYFAAHPESDSQTLDALQQALDGMKEDGTYSDIVSRYLHRDIRR